MNQPMLTIITVAGKVHRVNLNRLVAIDLKSDSPGAATELRFDQAVVYRVSHEEADMVYRAASFYVGDVGAHREEVTTWIADQISGGNGVDGSS